jgi:hypothetical protein
VEDRFNILPIKPAVTVCCEGKCQQAHNKPREPTQS